MCLLLLLIVYSTCRVKKGKRDNNILTLEHATMYNTRLASQAISLEVFMAIRRYKNIILTLSKHKLVILIKAGVQLLQKIITLLKTWCFDNFKIIKQQTCLPFFQHVFCLTAFKCFVSLSCFLWKYNGRLVKNYVDISLRRSTLVYLNLNC